ncbi:MAG TPA: helix-turn-helix domain-containing protein [Blastocatellia bacterium]|nr:helix-turn-helix domain-containing protein [Blastocatellia bacterium]
MTGSHNKAPDKKDLGRYVSQVMKAKGLSPRDVSRRSGKGITASYVAGIMRGNAANPSVDKMKALASGLDVDRYELFDIACGPSDKRADRPQGSERLQTLELLDLMKKAAVSPALMATMEQAAQLQPGELEAVLLSIQRLIGARRKAGGKGKRR